MTERVPMKELDRFYVANDLMIDELLGHVSWHELTYDRKLEIHEGSRPEQTARTPATTWRIGEPPRFPWYSLTRYGYNTLHGATDHNSASGKARHFMKCTYLNVPIWLRPLVWLENAVIRFQGPL